MKPSPLDSHLSLGTRVMVLDHPQWQGGKLQGYEGVITGRWHGLLRGLYEVSFPFLVKKVQLPAGCICPVYNDCEVCGYAAWRSVEDKQEKRWHHFCAWHLTPTEELV